MCGPGVFYAEDGRQKQKRETQDAPKWQVAYFDAVDRYSAETIRAIWRVIRVNRLCDEGKLIAWKSARMVEDAIDAATTRRIEEVIDKIQARTK